MKQITIIAGIFLAFTGMWCFARSGEPFINMAFLFGAAMMMGGVSNIFTYLAEKKTGQTSGYLFAEGMMTVIYSVIVLANGIVLDPVIPVFFGMWMISTGTMRVMAAIRWHKTDDPDWKWFMGFGVCTILFGAAAFTSAITTSVSNISLLGIFFLLQGLNMIIVGIHMKHKAEPKKSKSVSSL